MPREQINPRDPVNPRDPLRQQQPRGAECSAHWCCAAARGKGGRAVRGRFHSSGSVRGSFPGAALPPTVTVRPRSRGSPAGSSLGNWPRSRGASPHCPAGRDREFWGHPRLVWSGAAPTGCPCGGTCTGHQERDAATALRLDPEGRRGPGGELGAAVQMAPRDWVLVPRGAGLVGFLLRAGGVDHRGPCPTQCPQISLHLPGRGLHEYPSTRGCAGVSSCSWRCWWLAAPRARGFARHRLAPRGFGEGMATQPHKMYFSSRLSRVFLPPARCRGQRTPRPVKDSVLQSRFTKELSKFPDFLTHC